MNSRLVCTPQICSLSTEVAALSGSFVIALRRLKKQPEGLKRSLSVSPLKYVCFFFPLRQTEVMYLNLTKIQWLHQKCLVYVRQNEEEKQNFGSLSVQSRMMRHFH